MPLRILISAGGTGGGVYPALAVIDALGERADVLWVGARGGMEEGLVRRHGLACEAISAGGLHGVVLGRLPGNLWRTLRGIWETKSLIGNFDPEVLFFTGGYVGGPAAIAGWRRPKVTFVPDIEPALAQRLISRVADRICVPAEEARRYYRDPSKVKVTGYPTRFEELDLSKKEASARLGLTAEAPVLLVMGGSRGARSINRAIWSSLEDLLELAQVIHVIGERDWPLFEEEVGMPAGEFGYRYHPHAYLHETMADALASADLAVSRAGASTLGEYPLFGLPAVLVPYPHAWRYQKVNAAYLAKRDAAVVMADERLETDLLPLLENLLSQPDRLEEMSEAAVSLTRTGAAERIAEELLAVAGRRQKA
ncbi:MAG: UDP-N-acetylglucosamine--N-acetylmuramyl-(pentapeptide) pyrophosphoryl-undecaprenol N-acetylglucosamine transferase [Anaerolineales bacterium]